MSKGLLLTYILTYGGGFVALFQPYVGSAIYSIYVVLRPQELWFYAVPQHESYSYYVALATLIGWSVRGFPRGGSFRGSWSVILLMAGLAGVVRVSAWMAFDPLLAEPVASTMVKIFVMFFVGFCLIDSIYRLKIFLWVFILTQGYLTFELNIPYFWGGENVIVMRDGFGALNNNTFALSLLPGIGLALMTSINESRFFWRGLALASFLSSVHIILLSESRGGYIGLLAIGIFSLYFMPKNAKSISLFLVVLLFSFFLVGESVQKEFATMFAEELDDSAASRFDLWSAAYHVMLDYPLLGVGPMNFGLFSANYYNLEEGRAAHNLYMQAGSDCGVTGLVIIISLYVAVLKKILRIVYLYRKKYIYVDNTILIVLTGSFSGIIGYLVHSFFSSGIVIENSYMAIMIALSAVRIHSKNISSHRRCKEYGETVGVIENVSR
jgi:O-antigen ligase